MTTVDVTGLLRLAPLRLRHHASHTELRSAHEGIRRNQEESV